jgi:hypothetical protein
MRRKGTRNPQFVQRIPASLRDRMIGMRLSLPVGSTTVPIRITPSTHSIRVSLRTPDPIEAKNRQAGIAAYLARVFAALREERPLPLTHRQAVALSGELYRAWAKDIHPADSITLVNNEDGSVEISRGTDSRFLGSGSLAECVVNHRCQIASSSVVLFPSCCLMISSSSGKSITLGENSLPNGRSLVDAAMVTPPHLVSI